MLTKQAVSKIPKEHSNKGFLSQLFSVPKKDGGTRPIINLKGLNTFVETVHFKMEGIHVLRDTLKPGDWITKVDLKDAYFMIPMASHHKCLLIFRWQGQTYQFNCLPFGLSSTPWVFTKTTRLVVATLRSLGLRVIIIIHRRHTYYGSIAHSGERTHSRSAGESGFHLKPPQVTPDTYTGNRLPGLCGQL